jgi:hypothetical protein
MTFLISAQATKMSQGQMKKSEVEESNKKAAAGEEVVPEGKGGKSLEAQEHLAEGRKKGGETRKSQMTHEDYQEMGREGGSATKKSEDKEEE